MNILAIETTTGSGSLAVQRDHQIIYTDYFALRNSHSETIMPRIDGVLKLLEIEKRDLNAVCVSIGPGSFTGCRIGLATAKGICSGLRIPLITFNSLEILATNMYGTDKKIISILDARMGEVYVAVYDTELNVEIEPHCRAKERVFEGFCGEYVCVGDVGCLPPAPASCIIFALPHQNILSASAMLSLLRYRNITPEYDEKYINEIEPMYVRQLTVDS